MAGATAWSSSALGGSWPAALSPLNSLHRKDERAGNV